MQFISTLIVVFAIGMLIRWAIKKRKKQNSTNPTASAPTATMPPPSTSAAPSARASFCPQCGTPISLDSTFCANCGAKLQ
ncbi:MAG: zinc ribbon domain-containing protein [Dehalococcoidales bacterium]|nr:zinc ribbon domain-containing protein [Dehalococcoidales bacterium]